MTCPVCDLDYLNEIQCEYCLLPRSHFEYAKGIYWGGESAALSAVTENLKKISILDLTGREFLSLFKNFLKGQLVCTLILVVPYFILVYLGILGSPTESPTESPSKLHMGLNLAGMTLLCYWLMQDLKKYKTKVFVFMLALGISFFTTLGFFFLDTHLRTLFSALIPFSCVVPCHKYGQMLEAKAIVSEFDVVNQNSDNQTA